jgi:general stress protein 26
MTAITPEHVTYLRDLLGRIKFGTLATATPDGHPWNSPVVMVRDSDFNLYWFSDRQSQHGRNVRANPRVFIVIYDSSVPDGDIQIDRGLYLEATASEIDDPEVILRARTLKVGPAKAATAGFTGDAPRRVYQATPTRAWINDIEKRDGKFVRDVRVELPLDDLRQLLTP